MWHFILKQNHPQVHSPPSEQGFTMLEVLVSILATTAFLMGTLQAIVINAIFQVRAEREAQATFWIQEDMERVKAIAEMPPLDGTDGSHIFACFFGIGNDGFDNGYGGKLRDELAAKYSESGGSPNFQIAAEKQLVNKNYRLVRIIEGWDNNPNVMGTADETPHVLRITYKVGEPYDPTDERDGVSGDAGGDLLQDEDGQGFKETLAEVYTEVIPSGAFSCG